jgi:hypothetical protein
MAIPSSTTGAVPVPTTVPPADGFDQRWAAWQARGAAQDRAVARQMAIVAPLVAVAAIALVWFIGR